MHFYAHIILIIYFLQFTGLECQRMNIEPPIKKTFPNLALHRCYTYGVFFEDFYNTIKTIINSKAKENITRVATFYNPGVLGNNRPEKMADISYVYLQYRDISQKVNKDFHGLGILNYTAWNPIFEQNRGLLEYYYNNSIELEKNMYPLLNDNQTRELAKNRFEFSSEVVFNKSLIKIQNSWPQATWGLFDYPKCNSLSNEGIMNECDKDIMADNDRLSWLWDSKIALYPTFFFPTFFSRKAKRNYINARLHEAKRIADKYDPPLIIVPYLSLNYRDDLTKYLSYVDVHTIITTIVRTNVSDNIIIWSHSDNLNSKKNCQYFARYLDNEVAPVLLTQLNNIYGQSETNR